MLFSYKANLPTIVVVVLTAVSSVANGNEEEKVRLPALGPAVRSDMSYHLMFQLQMFGSNEKLAVEEWASFGRKKFRLDLISSEGRSSYLTDGESHEIFRYKPFVCDRLEPDSEELGIIARLFRGHPVGDVKAYGLGPLWLRASAEGKVRHLNRVSKQRGELFQGNFNSYRVKFDNGSSAAISFELNFHFLLAKYQFVDAVEWVDAAAAGDAANGTTTSADDERQIVQARAKLVYLDLAPVSESVFELPVGYGCQRGPKSEAATSQLIHQLDLGRPVLHEGAPSQARFEVIASRPKDELLRSWESHKYTVRIMRAKVKLHKLAHSYYVTQIQERDSATTRFKRTKKIWSALDNSQQALVYTIDQETQACKVGHALYKDHIRLNFPTGERPEASAEEEEEEEASAGQSATPPSPSLPMSLGTDLLSRLFNDDTKYHLIKKSTDAAGFTELVYERRIEKMDMEAADGSIVWSGPVSLVRTIGSPGHLETVNEEEPAVDVYHQTVTMFFYSKDWSRLLYKTVIDLEENEEVDIGFMQAQLDIGPCFPGSEQRQDVLIKYPIESQAMGRRLFAIKDIALGLFSSNLFTTTPIQPLQVTGLELSFDNFFLHIRMTLLDMPLTESYEFYSGWTLVQRLSQDASSAALIEQMAPNVAKCAASCDHYNCFRFSFDRASHRCRLEMKRDGASLEERPTSDLYSSTNVKMSLKWLKHDADGGRAHLKPQSMVELLSEFAKEDDSDEPDDEEEDSADSADAGNNRKQQEDSPLTIRVSRALLPAAQLDEPVWLKLKPVSVESETNSMNEFASEQLEQEAVNSTTTTTTTTTATTPPHLKAHDSSRLRVQYNLMLEDWQFKGSTAGQKLTDLSYDECASSCESADCRSFSYCEFSRTCHLTNLHTTKEIARARSRHDNVRCGIFALDYLSKFESFGRVAEPASARKMVEGVPRRDCALLCMEERDFSCQGFHYCRDPTTSSGTKQIIKGGRCLMQAKHIHEESASAAAAVAELIGGGADEEEEAPSSSTTNNRQCKFYSRSYLAQFDEYYERALSFGADDEQVALIEGLGAESCAKKCIEDGCLAFDACTESVATKSLHGSTVVKQVCQFAHRQLTKGQLSARKRCTTFVLSDKSQFNKVKDSTRRTLDLKPNRRALEQRDRNSGAADSVVVVDVGQQKALEHDLNAGFFKLVTNYASRSSISGSHWLSKLMSVTFGALLGAGCVLLWRAKDQIYLVASSFAGQRGRRG